MVKILTLDLWGTIVSSSSSKELIDYYISKVLNVDLEEFKTEYKEVKKTFNFAINTQENFWALVLKKLKLNTIDPYKFTNYVNSLYKRNYVPNYNNIEGIVELVKTAKHSGYVVHVLSNVGYLTSKQVNKLILSHPELRGNLSLIGSDMLCIEKPNTNFYYMALEHHMLKGEFEWIHIGDSKELDGVSTEVGAKFLQYNNYSDWDKFLNEIK